MSSYPKKVYTKGPMRTKGPPRTTCLRCEKAINQKGDTNYTLCYTCNLRKNCPACRGTGISYWSDGMYGECMMC